MCRLTDTINDRVQKVSYIASAHIGVIQEWLKSDRGDSPQRDRSDYIDDDHKWSIFCGRVKKVNQGRGQYLSRGYCPLFY
jgi:hypothetical protein